MVRQFGDEELNFFKFLSIVNKEFPRALRQTFKAMWDNKFGSTQPWDDSEAVRNSFLIKEGYTTKVPTKKSYEKWDCTALCKATIYAQCFALPDSKGHHKILSDLYVKPRGIAEESFHTSVASPTGNNAETFTLAIDQLRRLRNFLAHNLVSGEMDKSTFHKCVQRAKDAFKALGVKTDSIVEVGNLKESHFPTKEVATLRRNNRLMGFVLFD